MAHTLSERQHAARAADENALSFAVLEWSVDGNHLERVLSRFANMLVARATFEESCRLYPGSFVTLQHGARLISIKRPDE
ncbi:hypothetical protein [Microvirga terricola]|uniref:Uncharacterized protein n=1 Tax=Microvirga terricola TaxID=2719797 RepID=A0ABX0VDX7_9HYPH|nr:hypothetical protein [Microvirga terricola]NIX77374.1 hypothetical protein [Microvirga terricola]